MDKSLILNEIRKYLNIKTDTEFANFLGIKQNTLSSWKARNSIDYDLIISKCDYLLSKISVVMQNVILF